MNSKEHTCHSIAEYFRPGSMDVMNKYRQEGMEHRHGKVWKVCLYLAWFAVVVRKYKASIAAFIHMYFVGQDCSRDRRALL